MALPQQDGLDLKAYLVRQRSIVDTYLDRFLPPPDTRPRSSMRRCDTAFSPVERECVPF